MRHSSMLVAVAGLFLLSSRCLPAADNGPPIDLSAWTKLPADFKGAEVAAAKATLHADKWSYLLSKSAFEHFQAKLQYTIQQPARNFTTGGHGDDWNAYKFQAYDDLGYEVGVLLRANGADSGYRVQLSTKYQEVALLKYPFGSFLRVEPCEVKLNQPQQLEVSAQANEIVVKLDGKELIRYADTVLPFDKGTFGIGTGSAAKVVYEAVTLNELPRKEVIAERPHVPDFQVRPWRGQRWVFDGQEPILLLFTPQMTSIQNVKLKPGYRCVLLWDAAWGIANQGAYAEGACKLTEATVGKSGKTLELSWQGKSIKDAYVTNTTMVIGYDAKRKMYTYDVDSALNVLRDFEFRYGFDFEHHTPLGPFYSKYLVVTSQDGKHYYRPVYPIDPGSFSKLSNKGIRMWYGRTNEPRPEASPAIEYDIPDSEKRELSTAVCACMYDTGIAFGGEKARAGTKIAVKYRYTGYPPDEAERVFKSSAVYPVPSIDPNRHLIFAEYPKTTFTQFLPLDQPWWGKRPFVSGHGSPPPSYYLEKNTGFGSGFAMRLGPRGQCAAASLPTPSGPLPKGKYIVSAYVKGDNLIGPGGYLNLLVTDQQLVHGYTGGHVRQSTKVLKEERHWIGNGTFNWKRTGFVTELIGGAPAIAVEFGNAGTGDLLVTDLEIQPLKDGDKSPEEILAKANERPPAVPPAAKGAIADYRMEEGKGAFVHDYAGKFGPLELANVEWIKDQGRFALKFADYQESRGERLPNDSVSYRSFLAAPHNKEARRTVFAFAGAQGGGGERKAFSLCVETKPAQNMRRKPGYWGTDIAGLGGRAVKIIINNEGKLTVSLHFKEYIVTDVVPEADKWYQIAVTGEAKDQEKMTLRIYVNGKLAKEHVSQHFSGIPMGDSLVLATELYYLDNGFYGGLIGRVTVFDRALSAAEVAEFAKGLAK